MLSSLHLHVFPYIPRVPCIRNPALAGVYSSSLGDDSASCPCRTSNGIAFWLHQRPRVMFPPTVARGFSRPSHTLNQVYFLFDFTCLTPGPAFCLT